MKVNVSIMQEDIMMNGIVKDVLQDEIVCEMEIYKSWKKNMTANRIRSLKHMNIQSNNWFLFLNKFTKHFTIKP